jgi:hypothetical protein
MRAIIVVLALLCLFLGVSWWNSTIEHKKELSMSVLNDSLLQKKVLDIRDSAGRQIQVYKTQSITSQQLATSQSAEMVQLRKDLKLAGGKQKNINSSTSVHTNTHDTVSVAIHDTIKLADTGKVSIPFSTTPDTFIRITGINHLHHLPGSLIFDSITLAYSISNRLSVTHFTKHPFLRKSTTNLLITSDNPHTDIGKVQNYSVVNNKKFFQKWYFHVGCGVLATLVAQHYIK